MKKKKIRKITIVNNRWIPYLILIISLLITTVGTYYLLRSSEAEDRLRFQNEIANVEYKIGDSLNTYIALLRGGAGLFAANGTVSKEQFSNFMNRISIKDRYPGIQGIGYSVKVRPEDKENFIEEMRREVDPNFNLHPDTPREEYHAIIYLEPLDRRNKAAIGYDMFSEPIRREAMERARDKVTAAASGKVTLVQEIDQQKQPGFLIYVPVYTTGTPPDTVEERRNKLKGFVYSPLRAGDFLEGIFENSPMQELDFQIYDGDNIENNSVLYQLGEFTNREEGIFYPHYKTINNLSVAGHNWTIVYNSTSEFAKSSKKGITPLVFIGGMLVSFLLFSLSRTQYLAQVKSLRMTSELQESEHNLQDSNRRLIFLAEASKVLSTSLDYNKTLKKVAKLAVPYIADWCLIDIKDSDKVHHLITIHKDSRKLKLARELRKKYPQDINGKYGLNYVLQTGKSELVSEITEEYLEALSQNKKINKIPFKLGLKSYMIVPIKDSNKVIGAITFVSSDLGHNYTKEDLQMAEELSHRVSLSIENARLYYNEQKAVKLRDEFISVASHELKTPVTSLKMYIQFVQQLSNNITPETLIQYLNKVDTQINKLTTLINDLLDVSRIQSGKLEYKDAYFDINETIREVVDSMQTLSNNHQIIVQGKSKVKVWADKDRITQVLTNLLSNAVKYSPDADKVIISVKSENNSALVTVEDFGLGIDPENLEKIFYRFYQVNNQNTKTFPGLGLGLYISNEIIKRYGKTIKVESIKGHGSKFTFTLPTQGKVN